MKLFIVGAIFGLVLATVGVSGIARIFDKGVTQVQGTAKELAK
jgi:hypothetical protein